ELNHCSHLEQDGFFNRAVQKSVAAALKSRAIDPPAKILLRFIRESLSDQKTAPSLHPYRRSQSCPPQPFEAKCAGGGRCFHKRVQTHLVRKVASQARGWQKFRLFSWIAIAGLRGG